MPKKEGMTVVTNERNELVPMRPVTGWRVCMDYQKLNAWTEKDHFPMPFLDHLPMMYDVYILLYGTGHY